MRNIRTNVKQTLLSAALCACMGGFAWPHLAHAQATEQAQSWQIASGPLEPALRRVMTQGKLTISYSPALVAGKRTRGLSGAYAPAEALRRLLDGTGLAADAINGSTFALREVPPEVKTPPPAREPKPNAPAAQQSSESETKELDTITVTGTRIRGAQPSSPLVMISQEEMRLAGHNNLGEVIRSLPQNFSGGQNPGVQSGATGGGIGNQNITGGSSLNLRGLGPDATLTLLNGARLPYDGFSQATDVAVIPMAAIERMEVLLDGASALYGSDAVGGVANVILKRDYDGAELTARYGEATSGGYEQTQISSVVGTTWETGALLVAGETLSSSAVRADQRNYLSYISNPNLLTIYPKSSQRGILISGHQQIGSQADLSLDAFQTKRSMENRSLTSASIAYDPDTSIYGISPSLRITLPRDWMARVYGFMGEDETKTDHRIYSLATGVQTSQIRTLYRNRSEAAGVEFEGAVFSLPGGNARLSIGGGWRKAEYVSGNLITGVMSAIGENSSYNAYGEISLPFTSTISVNGALRYEDYDRFGSTTTPKVGATWKITPNLDIRASWGESFKAPTATEQYQSSVVQLFTAAALGVPDVPSSATILYTTGGNPNLDPERADVITAGLTFRPSFLPGMTIEAGWFDVDYTQRVVTPFTGITPVGRALNSPAHANFIVQNPTSAQQESAIRDAMSFINASGTTYDPANVIAMFDNRNFNASFQRVRGVDLDVRYVLPAMSGQWTLNAGGSWITDSQRKNLEGAAAFDTAGVVSFPPKFKGRIGATWSGSAFSWSAIVNHLGGVRNTRLTPSPQGDSMTTLDLVADYAADPSALNGFGFNVSISNVFNQRPPFIAPALPYHVNYDSTNYSSLGRVVSVAITKRF